MTRKAISKKLRFDVFKRDQFTCQYCGSTPPAAILHVDHINPVKLGGDNNIDNLATSCNLCNLGKGASPLSSVPMTLEQKAADIAEKELQIKGYNKIINARKKRLENERWEIVAEILGVDQAESFPKRHLASIKAFQERLSHDELLEAGEIANWKFPNNQNRAFTYFCGICWRKIKEVGDGQGA